MSDAASYPPDAGPDTFLLTVRGQIAPATVEDARMVHNSTAGAPPSVEGARSLGDLSHNVFVGRSDNQKGELLFIDLWNSPSGLGQFFANPHVQEAAGQLFTARDAAVWASLAGFGDFHLLLPAGKTIGGVGILRTTVASVDGAAAGFAAYAGATVNQSRLFGIVSHSTWVKAPNPGEEPTAEIISVDLWSDPDDMDKYYELGVGFEHLAPVFAGTPDTSSWQAAPGQWTEW
jgi:hypothetical protein